MPASSVLFPPLKWAQRQDYVLITIELQDSTNVKLQLPNGGAVLSFACDVPEVGGSAKHYACEFDLFKAVSAEESDFVARPRQIEVKLKKKEGVEEEEAFWPRLTKEKTKNKNIAIDWARWKDEDEDLEGEMDMGDFGLGGGMGDGDDTDFTENMMQQFAVRQGQAGAEEEMGAPLPAFGSAQGQTQTSAEGDAEEDEDLPPLEEDN